jgi:hypothetical protein
VRAAFGRSRGSRISTAVTISFCILHLNERLMSRDQAMRQAHVQLSKINSRYGNVQPWFIDDFVKRSHETLCGNDKRRWLSAPETTSGDGFA